MSSEVSPTRIIAIRHGETARTPGARSQGHLGTGLNGTWRVPDTTHGWRPRDASLNRLRADDEGFVVVGWADSLHLEAQALDETSDLKS